MAHNFEDEEQLEDIKAWWAKYGTMILTVVTIVAVAVAAWRLWGWYQDRQALKAAGAYEILRVAASEKDMSRVKVSSRTIFEDHSSSIYAPMAGLVAARAYFDEKDLDGARDSLQWVVDNTPDSEFAPVARLRLAGVLLDQGAADKGLEVLEEPVPDSFAGAFAERRGDLLSTLSRNEEAVQAYEKAVSLLGPQSRLNQTIQLKLQALKAGLPGAEQKQ